MADVNDRALYVLAEQIGAKLRSYGMMMSTAESCTGGWVGQALTAVPGSSYWYDRGFITYSNEAKQELLKVSADTIARHGAVSEAVAREMALGALAHSRAKVALAVSGVAGPAGGSEAKPVGTVCFAWAGWEEGVRCITRHFDGDRQTVRAQAVEDALLGLLHMLEEAPPPL
jgi:nicotinamide-nucleotide amidase